MRRRLLRLRLRLQQRQRRRQPRPRQPPQQSKLQLSQLQLLKLPLPLPHLLLLRRHLQHQLRHQLALFSPVSRLAWRRSSLPPHQSPFHC